MTVTEMLLFAIACLVWWFGTKIQERLGKLIRLQGGVPPGER